jgi:uncharacterized protein
MKFIVLFEDNAGVNPDIRRKHMAEHLAFLERHAATIKAAGPLIEDGRPAGGLWVVEANDAKQIDALVREDPLWPTGLRKSVRVLAWTQVFADGRRVIAV